MFVNEYLSFCHFYAKAIGKKGKRAVSFTHELIIICSQTQLDNIVRQVSKPLFVDR